MLRPERTYDLKAHHAFTDLNEPCNLFFVALNNPQPHKINGQGLAAHQVLVFYGVGRQSKSRLCQHLDDWLTQQAGKRRTEGGQPLTHLALDLEDDREGRFLNPAETLLQLRLALKACGGFSSPHFDVAFARYFALSRPGVNIRSAHPELFYSPNELLDDIVNVAGETLSAVPGWGFLYKYAERLRGQGLEWWERRGLGLLRDLDGKNQAELLQALPLYLGADLTRAQELNPQLRLVILLDTYEYLWRNPDQRGHSYLIDDWLQRLIVNAPGVLFTLFSRDKLRWGEQEKVWNERLEQHRLGGLSEEDSDHYLCRAGLNEADIRRVIIASSKAGAPEEEPACLPYYLDLQLQQYEKDRNSGRTPQVETYGGSHTEITERFLKPPYTDRTALQTLFVVTCARTLTRNLYDALTQALLAQQALPYHDLLSYSFVAEQDGQVVVHALMREYLQAKFQTEDLNRFLAVHHWLFTYYDARAQPETATDVTPQHEGALREAAFHKELAGTAGFAAWCVKRCGIFREAAHHALTSELYLQAWAISERVNRSEHRDTLISMSNLALNLHEQTQYAEAQRLNEQVLEVRKRTLGEEHRDTLISMSNLALNFHEQTRYAEAQRLNERVLKVSTRTLGEEHRDTLTSMNNLASNLHEQARYTEAQRLNEQVLEVRKRTLGEEHPITLVTLSNLARTIRDGGNIDQALTIFEGVVSRSVCASGETHPNTLRYRYHLAATLFEAGEYERVRRLLADLCPTARKVLGSEHSWTLEIKKLFDNLSNGPRACC